MKDDFKRRDFGLAKSLNSLYLNKDFADFTFRVNGEHEVKAHKFVLAGKKQAKYETMTIKQFDFFSSTKPIF